MKKFKSRLLLVILVLLITAGAAFPQGTAFTYQGRLTDGGTPANGNYDLQFALWDSQDGGTQVGSTQTISNVLVSAGIFTVQLDFGANAFSGASRFLQISARLSGAASFMLLSPRQQITSTPYAVRSLNAATADTATNATQLGGVTAANYVQTNDSRLTDARPPTAGSSNYIQNTTSQQSSSNFNISGNGTAGGTLSGNVMNATTQYNINGNRAFVVTGAGSKPTSNTFVGVGAGVSTTPSATTNDGHFNSFFGTGAGTLNTTGPNNSFFGVSAGQSNTTGGANSFFGVSAGQSNTTSNGNSFFGGFAGAGNTTGAVNSFFGRSAGISNTTENFNTFLGAFSNGASGITRATAIGFQAQVTQSNSLVLGSINGVNGATADTNVGIGTTAPTERLHVVGNGLFTGNLTVNGTLNATLPAGSANYIQNTTSQQASSNFNISGNGTAGGTLSGNVVNAATQYNLGGSRALIRGTNSSLVLGDGVNVGIGTTVPASVLHVAGSKPPAVSTGSGTNATQVLQIMGGDGGDTSDSGTGGGAGASVFTQAGNGGQNSQFGGGGNGGNVLTQAGNGGGGFGGGGTGGSITLQAGNGVSRGGRGGSITLQAGGGSGGGAGGSITFQAGPNGAFIGSTASITLQATGGNVGIGTTAPQAKLHVVGGSICGGPFCDGGAGTQGRIIAGGAAAELTFLDRAATSFVLGPANGERWVWYGDGGRARLWSGGDKLSVDPTGNVRAAGTVTASTTPDLAETIAADESVTAGDLVCADPHHAERAIRCAKNDRAILGVISDGSSGFLINSRANSPDAPLTGKPLVLAGRVPVKVSLENGPIQIGDFLSSSSMPGIAMRASELGPTVGIALEAFGGKSATGGRQTGSVLCFVKAGDGNASATLMRLSEDYARLQRENAALNARLGRLERQQDQVGALQAANAAVNARLRAVERTLSRKPGPARWRR